MTIHLDIFSIIALSALVWMILIALCLCFISITAEHERKRGHHARRNGIAVPDINTPASPFRDVYRHYIKDTQASPFREVCDADARRKDYWLNRLAGELGVPVNGRSYLVGIELGPRPPGGSYLPHEEVGTPVRTVA